MTSRNKSADPSSLSVQLLLLNAGIRFLFLYLQTNTHYRLALLKRFIKELFIVMFRLMFIILCKLVIKNCGGQWGSNWCL